MSTGEVAADLIALADKVVAQAQAGEQIEAYVSRGGETEVRVYGGEVEHFVSAQSEGIGVRVIRDGNLIGNGPAALAAVDAVGNDFAMGSPGTCGKDGQGVPVGTGTPTLRVPSLTVGGTAA